PYHRGELADNHGPARSGSAPHAEAIATGRTLRQHLRGPHPWSETIAQPRRAGPHSPHVECPRTRPKKVRAVPAVERPRPAPEEDNGPTPRVPPLTPWTGPAHPIRSRGISQGTASAHRWGRVLARCRWAGRPHGARSHTPVRDGCRLGERASRRLGPESPVRAVRRISRGEGALWRLASGPGRPAHGSASAAGLLARPLSATPTSRGVRGGRWRPLSGPGSGSRRPGRRRG